MIFRDREDAGRRLVSRLERYRNHPETLVLAIPRGGLVTGSAIAKGLGLPLDIVVTRKIGAPQNPEFAIGAVTADGFGYFDEETIRETGIPYDYLKAKTDQEKQEAERRIRLYRFGKPLPEMESKTILLVDDGIATGSTVRAAIAYLRRQRVAQVVVVTPVISANNFTDILHQADDLIVLDAPLDFGAVGEYYRYFPQVSDQEAIEIMGEFLGK